MGAQICTLVAAGASPTVTVAALGALTTRLVGVAVVIEMVVAMGAVTTRPLGPGPGAAGVVTVT